MMLKSYRKIVILLILFSMYNSIELLLPTEFKPYSQIKHVQATCDCELNYMNTEILNFDKEVSLIK